MRSYFLTDLPPGGGLERSAAFGAEQAAVGGGAVAWIPEDLHQILLDGYQTVRPVPPGYEEHQAALLMV